MPVKSDIAVIPNFLDCACPSPRRRMPAAARTILPAGRKLVIHISNLRPVKQVDAVVRVFAQIRQRLPARLLIVGEGPELGRAEQLIERPGRDRPRRVHRRSTGCGRPAVSVGSLPVAVAAGELRLVGARGDGVRSAGRGVERRGIAGSRHRWRDRVSASAGSGGADG